MIKTHKILSLLVLLCGYFLFCSNSLNAQAFNWTTLGAGNTNGTNGMVNAITVFNGKIIVGGSFSQAGGIPASNIAQWDAESGWAPLGNGLNSTVFALQVWNNQLYAGGSFTSVPGGPNVSRIARWTGSTWLTVGFPFQGVNNDVLALAVYNNNLVIAGKFNVAGGNNTAYRIVKWTGTNWVPLGSSTINGVNDEVYTLTVTSPITGDLLIVGGKFTRSIAGDSLNYIASWDEGSWAPLNRGMDERVYALTIHDSTLYAGGWFLNAGGVSARYIAKWNGINWSSLPKEVDDRVSALVSYRGELVAAGWFRYADTLYAARIAKWNGTAWSRLITGMNNRVNALCVNDTDLYAGGEFNTAGGKVSRYVSSWGIRPTRVISGSVRYIDNNQTVNRGKARAVRLDISTREVIVVDTTSIFNGLYTLPKVLIDTVFIVVVPNDELEDNFVPTYHDSTIDWRRAVEVYPLNNLNNINVFVIRALPPEPDAFGSIWIGGHVYLNYLPPTTYGLPYKSDAIVYAKRDGLYRTFAVSNTTEQYRLVPLTPGTYDLAAYRLGFTSDERTVILASTSIDTIDFYLDTVNPIGIKNINLSVPKNFALYQNYPNPFNPVTVIKFAVLNRTFVTMKLYNILGQDVITLVNEDMEPGEYELTLNASALPSGVYFYRLIAEGFAGTRKMILVK